MEDYLRYWDSKGKLIDEIEIKTVEAEVCLHYQGDPMSVCETCSKSQNCKEECLMEKYDHIPHPRHFEQTLVIDGYKLREYYKKKLLET